MMIDMLYGSVATKLGPQSPILLHCREW